MHQKNFNVRQLRVYFSQAARWMRTCTSESPSHSPVASDFESTSVKSIKTGVTPHHASSPIC